VRIICTLSCLHSHSCSWCTVEICTAVISPVLSLDEHWSQTNSSCVPKFCYHSVYCCIIRYFLARISTAKRFTNNNNNNKRFWCDVMFENEHTFRSWIYHIAPVHFWRNWHGQRPSNQGDLDSSVTGEVGRVYFTGVDVLLVLFLYRSTWLLMGCVLNGTLFIMHIAGCFMTRKGLRQTSFEGKRGYNTSDYAGTAPLTTHCYVRFFQVSS
jgi:hypothetical protein